MTKASILKPVMWMRTNQAPSPYAHPPKWPLNVQTKRYNNNSVRPPPGWDGTLPPQPVPIDPADTMTPTKYLTRIKSKSSFGGLNAATVPTNPSHSEDKILGICNSSDHVLVTADLSLVQRRGQSNSPKINKTGLSRTLNSSELVTMSRSCIKTPIGKQKCLGDSRQFSSAGNRLLRRPSTAGTAISPCLFSSDVVQTNDWQWCTVGTTSTEIFSGPKKKSASASRR